MAPDFKSFFLSLSLSLSLCLSHYLGLITKATHPYGMQFEWTKNELDAMTTDVEGTPNTAWLLERWSGR